MNKSIVVALIIVSAAVAANADQIPGTKVAYLKNGKRKPAPKPVTPTVEEQLNSQISDLKKELADVQDRLKVVETKQAEAAAGTPVVTAEPSSSAVAVDNATKPDSQSPTELTYEGKHQSFDGSFWVFETAGYTLRCETACPALKEIDSNEKLVVHAKSGVIAFKAKQQVRTCQVSQCAPITN